MIDTNRNLPLREPHTPLGRGDEKENSGRSELEIWRERHVPTGCPRWLDDLATLLIGMALGASLATLEMLYLAH